MKELISCKYAPIIENTDPLSLIGSVFWSWAEADRFGILNKYSPYNFVTNPIKEKFNFTTTTKTMEELVDNRACEIIKKSIKNNKKIVVLWSGGIDSTAIICSFIKNGCTKDQLILMYTNISIKEYPLMYNSLRKTGYRMLKFNWINRKKAFAMFPNDYFIIGWCADQLFGSNVNQMYPEEYRKNFKEGLTNILIKRNNIKKELFSDSLDLYEDYAKSLGVELKYTCDALWLFNFAVKWSHVSMDLYMNFDNPKQRENIINFFEDINFQEWSFTHYQEFHKEHQKDPKLYKKPLKNYIYSFNKDEEYLNTKGKLNSWGNSGFKAILYDNLTIVDTEGCHIIDLNKPTPWSKELKHLENIKNANRMYYLLDYIKPNIDIEKIKSKITFLDINYKKFYS